MSWLKDFCNDYYPKKYGKSFYMEEKDMEEPSIELFLYNCYKKIYNSEPVYRLRMLCQYLFRKNHISDRHVSEAFYYLAKKMLPLLKAYRDSEHYGWPAIYSEYNEDSGFKNIEDWRKKYGDCKGGEAAGWNKDLNEMIFSLEYTVGADSWHSEFWKKYYGCYLDDAIDSNKHVTIYYKNSESDDDVHVAYDEKDVPDGSVVVNTSEYYHNDELYDNARSRAREGMRLFGEMFFNLWL